MMVVLALTHGRPAGCYNVLSTGVAPVKLIHVVDDDDADHKPSVSSISLITVVGTETWLMTDKWGR